MNSVSVVVKKEVVGFFSASWVVVQCYMFEIIYSIDFIIEMIHFFSLLLLWTMFWFWTVGLTKQDI